MWEGCPGSQHREGSEYGQGDLLSCKVAGEGGWLEQKVTSPHRKPWGTGLAGFGVQRAAFPAGCLLLQRLLGPMDGKFCGLGSWVTPKVLPSKCS